MSNKTPRKDKADKPPLQTVPGQREGEYKKAQHAVKRHPRPSPAGNSLRRVAGSPKSMAALIAATERVLKIIAEAPMDGAMDQVIDKAIEIIDIKRPASSVTFTSAGVATSRDIASEPPNADLVVIL